MKLTQNDYKLLQQIQVERQRLRQEAQRLRNGKRREYLPQHINERLDDIAAQLAELTNTKLAEKFETSINAIEHAVRTDKARNAARQRRRQRDALAKATTGQD